MFVNMFCRKYRRSAALIMLPCVLWYVYLTHHGGLVNTNNAQNQSKPSKNYLEVQYGSEPVLEKEYNEPFQLPMNKESVQYVSEVLSAQKSYLKERLDTNLTIMILGGGVPVYLKHGRGPFIPERCNISCRITDDSRFGASAEAVLWTEGYPPSPPPWNRPPSQLWGVYLLEAPFSSPSLQLVRSKLNFTVTYRRDATIPTPYGAVFTVDNPHVKGDTNYSENKTKLVSWLVSNCHARNGRDNYVEELQKHIDVDIYGRCGTHNCGRKTSDCLKKIRKYKFYLAFENSHCRDYITEKFYNALK